MTHLLKWLEVELLLSAIYFEVYPKTMMDQWVDRGIDTCIDIPQNKNSKMITVDAQWQIYNALNLSICLKIFM